MLENFRNKKILIWGFGIEGLSAFNLIKEITNHIIVAVKNKNEYTSKYKNINFVDENEILDYSYDIVIKSSGVSKYKQEIETLKKIGTKITTIQNIFLSEINGIKKNNFPKVIGITGTKGKSTTSAILNHILNNFGYKSVLIGNIGISVLDILQTADKYDYIIIELSSYQCSMLNYNLDYSVVLNLYPEHIDWHLNHENYFRDKLNIVNYSNISFVKYGDDIINKYIDKINKNIIYFNNENNFYVKDNFIFYKNDIIYSINDINNINGLHIFENICAILNILKQENINIQRSINFLKTFKTLEHRLEIFYKDNKKNVIFVNDSISTIPEATIKAIEIFKNMDIYLILGGYDREQNYNELINIINKNKYIKKIYLTGQTGRKIFFSLNTNQFCKYYNYYETLVDLIKDIDTKSLDNTVVLFSPASPSYDEYKNFEERGNMFKNLMLNKII